MEWTNNQPNKYVSVWLLGLWVTALAASAGATTSIELVSRVDGTPPLESGPNRGSFSWVSITEDGQFIAVSSDATNLSPEDTNGIADVFVYSRASGSLELVSAGGNGASSWPDISDDGRIVAFHSDANNLTSGDTNSSTDIYVLNRDTGITRLVTPGGNAQSAFPRLSGNGRFVAFTSNANNLGVTDVNGFSDVYVYDLETESMDLLTAGANGLSWRPSISEDGRFVAFASLASDLVPGDVNNNEDIFVHDRNTDTIQRLTSGANGGSGWPSISGDGRYVVFESTANNLVAGDFNNRSDIFLFDRDTNTTELITVGSDGNSGDAWISADGSFITFSTRAINLAPGNDRGVEKIIFYDRSTETFELISGSAIGGSVRPKIGGDGRYVLFSTNDDSLVERDNNGTADILEYDRTIQSFERVPSGGVPFEVAGGNSNSGAPSISESGRFVAFDSNASDLVVGDNNNHFDIFVFDRTSGSNELLTANSSEGSRDPSISADGRFVAFESRASNLVVGDTNDRFDILVYDRSTASTESLSLGANGDSVNPAISADGRFVAFESLASNLVPGDTNGSARDIFLHDRQTGITQLLTAGGNGESRTPSISGDGRYVAYSSQANNLVAEDITSNIFDIYVYDRITETTELLTAGGDNWSLTPSISADGRFVAFASDAGNLASGDTNGMTFRDIFVHDRQTSSTELLTPDSDNESDNPSINADGRFVAFSSEASNLVLEDNNNTRDILVHDRVTGNTSSLTQGADDRSTETSISSGGGAVAFTSFALNLASNGTPALADILLAVTNEAPIADPLNITTNEDTQVAFVLTGSDPESSDITFEIAGQPANGALSGSAPELIYTPDNNFFGTDSFTFQTSDGSASSPIATVSISVAPVNDVPIGTGPSAFTTQEDTPISITLAGTDVDGDDLIFDIAAQPASGALFGSPPDLIYSPGPNFNGTDAFSFTLFDGELTSLPVPISISVTAANDLPIAVSQSLTTTADTPLAITLVGSDVDNDALSFSIVGLPTGGSLTGALPNVVYTPNGSFTGIDNFTFTVSDGFGTSIEASVSISVSESASTPPENSAPVADALTISTPTETPTGITLSGFDADSDPLQFSIVSLPTNGALSGTPPDLLYTPDTNFAGADSFLFTVADEQDTSDAATVTIRVVESEITLFSAVLPGSRSVEVDATATAFATLINAGSVDAVACELNIPDDLAADFFFEASDAATNAASGDRNVPIDIAAGTSQSFVIGITPTVEMSATIVAIDFQCANSASAPSFNGLNTLLLSASVTPVADIIALVATTSENGVMEMTNNTGFFTSATINLGSSATITVSTDTGAADLPLTLSLCQTDPATSVCINPSQPSTEPVIVEILEDDAPTFAVFASSSDSVALDPANSRVFLYFSDDSGEVRGTTSVAVQNPPTSN